MSPTARSLKVLRDAGFLVQVVEKWNPHARIRQDLFGFGDLLALKGGKTLLVQVTSASNVSSRVRKIHEHENFERVIAAGWCIEVHGWAKPTKTLRTWRQRVVRVTPEWATRELDLALGGVDAQ